MRLGFNLNIAQVQKLVMTPELRQAIQILQFNSQELNQFIDDQLLTNPVLDLEPSQTSELTKKKDEEKGEVDWKEYLKEYDDISYKQNNHQRDKEDVSFEQFVSAETTLTEHLLFQLQFAMLDSKYKDAGKFIIESLNKNGYLTTNVNEIVKAFHLKEDEVENILSIIQTFDPPGVGAINIQECLCIQARQRGIEDPNIFLIIKEHLDDIAENRLGNISKKLNIPIQDVQKITDFIKALEPKPGRIFSSGDEVKYITPDVTVEKIDGEYIVMVNDSTAPRLNVSSYYKRMLVSEDRNSNTSKFLTDKLNAAAWIIKNIEQRRQTIYNVVKSIVDCQEEFLEKGKKYIKPLTLKQIADEVGVHESTVSRAVNGKYIQCPQGVFEIKYFFNSGVSNQQGEGVASQSIKSMIKEMIEKENTRKPLSDQKISDHLQEKGINISRRTVAKYRDEMNVLPSSKRKRF